MHSMQRNISEFALEMETKLSLAQFYAGKCIFVTGATGLLGTALVESILYYFNDVGNVYILLRRKRNASPQDRFQELLNTRAFLRIRTEKPEVLKKLICIEGDAALPNMGLSDENRAILVSDVSVVVHCCANVRFDIPVKENVITNVAGTKCVIDLCKEMKKLQSFIHVSTAFSNCDRLEIDEVVHPVNEDPYKVLAMLDVDDDKYWEDLSVSALKQKPNPYIYSKALAETLVDDVKDELPVVIVRPSIVCGAIRDPEPGWTNSKNGVYGIVEPVGKGIVRIAKARTNVLFDFIPVDTVTNFILATAWNKAVLKNNALVYNCVSQNTNPGTWGDFQYWCWRSLTKYFPTSLVWYPWMILVSSDAAFKFGDYLLHYLPAAFVDFVFTHMGKKPQMVKYYNRCTNMVDTLNFFISREWIWKDDNRVLLNAAMTSDDRKLFPVHIEKVDLVRYQEYCFQYFIIHICKYKPQYFAKNAKRLTRLYYLHFAIVNALLALLIWYIADYLEFVRIL